MKLSNWEFLKGTNDPFAILFVTDERLGRKISQEKITPLQCKFVVWMSHEANSVCA